LNAKIPPHHGNGRWQPVNVRCAGVERTLSDCIALLARSARRLSSSSSLSILFRLVNTLHFSGKVFPITGRSATDLLSQTRMTWHRSRRVHKVAHAVAPDPGVTICSVMGAPFHPQSGAARRSPDDNPQWGCAPIPRNARWLDPYCSSGFRLAQQSGAWSAAAPSTSSKARPCFP
jgi:hypothetical protein